MAPGTDAELPAEPAHTCVGAVIRAEGSDPTLIRAEPRAIPGLHPASETVVIE